MHIRVYAHTGKKEAEDEKKKKGRLRNLRNLSEYRAFWVSKESRWISNLATRRHRAQVGRQTKCKSERLGDIFIKPIPSRLRDVCRRGGRKTFKSQR